MMYYVVGFCTSDDGGCGGGQITGGGCVANTDDELLGEAVGTAP